MNREQLKVIKTLNDRLDWLHDEAMRQRAVGNHDIADRFDSVHAEGELLVLDVAALFVSQPEANSTDAFALIMKAAKNDDAQARAVSSGPNVHSERS